MIAIEVCNNRQVIERLDTVVKANRKQDIGQVTVSFYRFRRQSVPCLRQWAEILHVEKVFQVLQPRVKCHNEYIATWSFGSN
jgi:hypothetical protein